MPSRLNTALLLMSAIALAFAVACEGEAESEPPTPPQSAEQEQEQAPPTQQQTEEPAAAEAEKQDEQEEAPQPEQQQEAEQEEPALPPNRAPVADAGPDGGYDLSEGFIVLGTRGSVDPDGDKITYAWTQIDGPRVALQHASENSAEARFESPRTEQTLSFRLRVTDEFGASSDDSVTLVFRNRPPTVDAGSDLETARGQTVTLNGRGTDDTDNTLAYSWTQVSGPAVELSDAAAENPTFVAPNEYVVLVFALVVNDGQYDSEPDTVAINIRNQPPVADAGNHQEVIHSTRVTLDGSASFDPEGDNITYQWSQMSGEEVALSNPAAAMPTFIAPRRPQNLSFNLVVSDGTNSSALFSGPAVVRISIQNDKPVARAGAAQEVSTGAWVTLDGSESSDPEGARITYLWTQTKGDQVILTNLDAVRPGFTAPQKSQTLIFRLEVYDGNDASTDTVRIKVSYEPVVASNFAAATIQTRVLYKAEKDAFTDGVRTDVRMRRPGLNGDLMLDVVCFDNGNTALGFWLTGLERDTQFADELEVQWRVDDGPLGRETLEVEYLGNTPAVYFQGGPGFESDWPNVFDGGSLTARINYRGVQEEVFDLDAFARTPVHGNLVNCGDY